MPYLSPTLSELMTRTRIDIENRTGVANIATEAIAAASAANAYGLHGRLRWLARNLVPHLADPDILLRHCEFWGILRKQPTVAVGELIVEVLDDACIDAGTRWQRPDGVILISTSDITANVGFVRIPVEAENMGTAGNTAAGVIVELISPVINVKSTAFVSDESISGGAELESIDSLRSRLLFRVQYPPSGGTEYDYIRWALECSGVTRAWCLPTVGRNIITVLFVLDKHASIFPTELDIQRVKDYITAHKNPLTNQWEGKPPCVELIVKGPKKRALNPAIRISPNNTQTQAAAAAALVNLLVNIDCGEQVYLSKMNAAVATANGVKDGRITSIVEDIYAQEDELIVLGDITWQ